MDTAPAQQQQPHCDAAETLASEQMLASAR